MNAVISGQSGIAVLVDGSRLASIHADSDGEIVERHPQEIRFLLNDARDLEFVEDVAPEDVYRQLQVATRKYDALHTALILLDSQLSHDTRRTAAEELEEDLANERIARWVESVLYAHPLPKSGELASARAACTGRTERVRAFLERLASLQATIAEVHNAWEAIPPSVFGTAEDRQQALSIAVKEGLFRELVLSRAAGLPVGGFLVTAVLNPGFKKIQKSRHILKAWIAAFREPTDEGLAPKLESSAVAEAGPGKIPQIDVRTGSAELLQRLRPRSEQVLARYRIPAGDAEDLIQDALLSTIYKWETVDDHEAWFLVALRNRCVVYWRKQRNKLYNSVDSAILDLLSEPQVAPQERAELLWDFNKLLENLPHRCRKLLHLRYGLGYDSSEVAEKMGYRPASVHIMSRRCVAALVQVVNREFTR